MPIVVEHQPAFAAPGMMAAQAGQLEYRNQRRRELEALAMKQAEMKQRQFLQNQNIASQWGLQDMRNVAAQQRLDDQLAQGKKDQRRGHRDRLELQQNDFLNRQKIAQQNAEAKAEADRLEQERKAAEDAAQREADYEAAIEDELNPEGVTSRRGIHAEYDGIKAELEEENAPEEAFDQAEQDYRDRLEKNKNNPRYRKPKSEHYPGEREEFSGVGEHTVYDEKGQPVTVFAGKKRNPSHIVGSTKDPGTGMTLNPDGTPYLDPVTGMPVPYEDEFTPYSKEEYLYDKREWRGNEADGSREYREGSLDEHGNYKPGTEWINTTEEANKHAQNKRRAKYNEVFQKWIDDGSVPADRPHPSDYLMPGDPGYQAPPEIAPEATTPGGDAGESAGEDAGGPLGPVGTASEAYPELFGSMAGDMSMEESMLTMGMTPETAGGGDAPYELTPEQIEARSQHPPEVHPRMTPMDYGVQQPVKFQNPQDYNKPVNIGGEKRPVPLYAIAPEDRQAVYEQRRQMPYMIKWPPTLPFNEKSLAGALMDEESPITFGTVVDLSKLPTSAGKKFAKAWEERTGSTNFVFERELMLSLIAKVKSGDDFNKLRDKFQQQEKEHYEFYGFPGDFTPQKQQGSAVDRILQAGGAR